jgi:hypothetical protein
MASGYDARVTPAGLDRIVIPWAALGLPAGNTPPKRFVVCVAGPDDIAHFAGGIVLEADDFDFGDDDDDDDVAVADPNAPYRRALRATTDGLFDERIFGPLPHGPDGLPLLAPPFHLHPYERPQARLFGTFAPHEPITSAWVTRYAPNAPPLVLDFLPVLPAGLRPTFV